jgi:3-dehydroquinate synthase
MPNISFAALWKAMQHDKKLTGGNVVGVWPVRIGEVVIRTLDKPACASWHRAVQSAGPNGSRRRGRGVRRIRRQKK